eukprot:6492276-Amphidinium_carterae.1
MGKRGLPRKGSLPIITPPWLNPNVAEPEWVAPSPKAPAVSGYVAPSPKRRSMGTASPAKIPRTPVNPGRSDAPILAHRARGSLDVALQTAADPCEFEAALEAYRADISSASSSGPNLSHWATWNKLHDAANGGDVLPLTPGKIERIMALFKSAGYRSINSLSRAKREHCLSYDWSASLEISYRDARRSLQRGMGPSKQASPFPLLELSKLQWGSDAIVTGGPVNAWALIVLGCFFMTREL